MRPVPPEETPRAEAKVRAPDDENVEVAVAPKAAVYAESAVVLALAICEIPKSVGEVPKTSAPVPVSSVRSAANSAEVSTEVEETLLLKSDQSDEVRKPLSEADAAWPFR